MRRPRAFVSLFLDNRIPKIDIPQDTTKLKHQKLIRKKKQAGLLSELRFQIGMYQLSCPWTATLSGRIL